jgi:hypothetical protein
MQGFSGPAYIVVVAQRAFDRVPLIFLGDCRKGQHLPWSAIRDLANEVCLMQPLHHHDDDAILFAVQPTQQRIEIPLVRRIASSLRERCIFPC